MSAPHHQRKKKSWQPSGRDKTASTQSSSRQSQSLQTLHQPLFPAIWEEKRLPDDWTEDVNLEIPKKGALGNCNNWKVIILLSVPSEILAKLLISEAVDQRLRQKQAGFRKRLVCLDQIFTVRNSIEQFIEWQRQLCIKYVDSEKVFNP